MCRKVLNGIMVPRAALLITHVKGLEGDLELVPRKSDLRNFLLNCLCAVTVMINSKTWLGAIYRTDALCRSISVYLLLICLNHKKRSSVCITRCHISAGIQYTKTIEHLKHATDLPMRETINHAKSSTHSRALVLISGPLNSSKAQTDINISAAVFGM